MDEFSDLRERYILYLPCIVRYAASYFISISIKAKSRWKQILVFNGSFFIGTNMKTCCFIGHRNTKETPELCDELRKTVIYLIEKQGVVTFYFGSKSKFDDICLKIVAGIKNAHPEIKLVYVRSHYPYIEQWYRDYLLESYDDTLMPSGIENAGKASYVERNQAMINVSDFCVFYYNEEYKPPLRKQCRSVLSTYQPKGGTKIAYEYAKQKKKEIINLFR